MALFTARRACEAAGLTALDRVADPLAALAEGRPLPPPFDDDTRMWETLATAPRVPDRTVGRAVPPERPPFRPPASTSTPVPQSQEAARAVVGPAVVVAKPPASGSGPYAVALTIGPPHPSLRISQPHMALPAVTGAAEHHPLRAALDAVHAAVAAYGDDHPALLAEVWSVVRGTVRVPGP